MAMFADVPAEARDGLGRLGLATVLDEYAGASDEFTQSERVMRRAQRIRSIGFTAVEPELTAEGAHNDEDLKHVEQALVEIRNARTQLDPGLVARINGTVRSDQGRQALARSRENFAQQLTEQDLHLDDFQQILGIWDSQSGQVASGGFSVLLDQLEASTLKLRDLRSQPSRGRERGSLPLWKEILIACTILVSLGAVIACFIWSACVWVMAFLGWYAPSLKILVELGC